MQVASISSKDPGGNNLLNRTYIYSPIGNITTKNTEQGSYTYGYDDLDRLTSALNPTLPNEAFTYDALGNRLASAATTGQWSHNANNELKGYDTTTFDYDPNGNLTRKTTSTQTRDFIYSVDDRLLGEK